MRRQVYFNLNLYFKSIQTVALFTFLMPEVIQVSTNVADAMNILKQAAVCLDLKYTMVAADQIEHFRNIAITRNNVIYICTLESRIDT